MALFKDASLLVQILILMLFVVSMISWTMIFRKWFIVKNAYREADRFEDKFWSGGNVNQIYADMSRKDALPVSGIGNLFVSGFREYSRLDKQKGLPTDQLLEGVQRSMRVALRREIDYLETNLPFLATVGSISPYVGLFGTVWGIMNSFRALSLVQQATLAHVAPGIAEALITTAMGLFAAIPAVIAYNRYVNDVERLISRYEIFMEEFASILQRQAVSKVAAA
ncbi:MAG: protein TolQ [Acidiferrobacteraceae bacterium]